MTINVYWASLNDNWFAAREPDSVFKNLTNKYKDVKFNAGNQLLMCPAVKDYHNNLFCLRSLQDYQFKINYDLENPENTNVTSNDLDQSFFQDRVTIRDLNTKMFSFRANTYLFFTDEKSLKISTPIHPYLEDNNITQRITPITGTFDIGRWFRPLDYGFFLKKDFDEFKISKDEVYAYIRFQTNEKINFKQFVINPELTNFTKDCLVMNKYSPLRSLENYYKLFKTKKLILKEIKKNLL